ncbi:hypothetical protein KEM54_002353 [Ascosphaera aggregata]|nr:hypothetical protein KEM54_002353 [Ascosphaera aggregata]
MPKLDDSEVTYGVLSERSLSHSSSRSNSPSRSAEPPEPTPSSNSEAVADADAGAEPDAQLDDHFVHITLADVAAATVAATTASASASTSTTTTAAASKAPDSTETSTKNTNDKDTPDPNRESLRIIYFGPEDRMIQIEAKIRRALLHTTSSTQQDHDGSSSTITEDKGADEVKLDLKKCKKVLFSYRYFSHLELRFELQDGKTCESRLSRLWRTNAKVTQLESTWERPHLALIYTMPDEDYLARIVRFYDEFALDCLGVPRVRIVEEPTSSSSSSSSSGSQSAHGLTLRKNRTLPSRSSDKKDDKEPSPETPLFRNGAISWRDFKAVSPERLFREGTEMLSSPQDTTSKPSFWFRLARASRDIFGVFRPSPLDLDLFKSVPWYRVRAPLCIFPALDLFMFHLLLMTVMSTVLLVLVPDSTIVRDSKDIVGEYPVIALQPRTNALVDQATAMRSCTDDGPPLLMREILNIQSQMELEKEEHNKSSDCHHFHARVASPCHAVLKIPAVSLKDGLRKGYGFSMTVRSDAKKVDYEMATFFNGAYALLRFLQEEEELQQRQQQQLLDDGNTWLNIKYEKVEERIPLNFSQMTSMNLDSNTQQQRRQQQQHYAAQFQQRLRHFEEMITESYSRMWDTAKDKAQRESAQWYNASSFMYNRAYQEAETIGRKWEETRRRMQRAAREASERHARILQEIIRQRNEFRERGDDGIGKQFESRLREAWVRFNPFQ